MVEIRDEGNGMVSWDARTPQEKQLAELNTENKRLKEEIEEWRENEGSVCPEDVGFVEYIKVLQAELEKHHWIPVSERLPKLQGETVSGICLITDSESVRLGWYDYKFSGWAWYPLPNTLAKPTHWKPIILPEQALTNSKGE